MTFPLEPGLCTLPEVIANCPIACNTKQACFTPTKEPKAYWTWDRIPRIDPDPTSNGTVCLSDTLDPASVIAACRSWRQHSPWISSVVGEAVEARWDDGIWYPATIAEVLKNGQYTIRWDYDGTLYSVTHDNLRVGGYFPGKEWLEDLTDSDGTRLNISSCDDLEKAIDAKCAFKAAEVEEFTREVLANGGDYSIAFWMKPTEVSSLHKGHFFPQAHFMSTISPPQHNFAVGKYNTFADGETRINTACFDGYGQWNYFSNNKLSPSSTEGWTFVTFRMRNSSMPKESAAFINALKSSHDHNNFAQCLYNSSSMFQMIEFNYPVLVSPIMMVPKDLPTAHIQAVYYNLAGDMKIRTGPLKAAADSRIVLNKRDYTPLSTLMAAPIAFQTRVYASAACPFTHSKNWLKKQHSEVVNSTCGTPYLCDDAVLSKPELTMSCIGELVTNKSQLGLDPIEFQGVVGFADILYSVSDTDNVFREGSVISTSGFFDSLTQMLSLIFVFFSPQYGLTSVLTINSDMSGPSSAVVDVNLQHYEVLEGILLLNFIGIECLLLLTVLTMSVDIVLDIRRLQSRRRCGQIWEIAAWKISKPTKLGQISKVVADSITVCLVIVSVAIRIWLKVNSSDQIEGIVGGLSSIPWDSSGVSMQEKKRYAVFILHAAG
jgi:hypothetical protein